MKMATYRLRQSEAPVPAALGGLTGQLADRIGFRRIGQKCKMLMVHLDGKHDYHDTRTQTTLQ